MLGYEELTEPERAIWNAVETGAWVSLALNTPTTNDSATGQNWGEDRQVRAQLLNELLTGGNRPSDARLHALRLIGARITGTLDLEGAKLVCPVVMFGCWFDEPVVLDEAEAIAIRLPGCHLPALKAAQLATRGNLELHAGFTAYGEVRLLGARIGGQLLLNGATLANPGGPALTGDGLTAGQGMYCHNGRTMKGEIRFTAEGEISLSGARIGGRLSFIGATLTNPGGRALSAGGLTVDQDMYCSDGFTAAGEVSISGAHIGGQLGFNGATLVNPGGTALIAEGLTADQGMYCREGFTAEGEVSLIGAHIAVHLELDGATLTNPDGRALIADGLIVDKGIFCRAGFTAKGEVRLIGAHIGGELVFVGATLINRGGSALVADVLTVDQGMYCSDGFTAEGEVRLTGAHIGGQLVFDGATLINPGGLALDLEAAEARDLYLRPKMAPSRVDLTRAKVGVLHDDQTTWPQELHLVGFTYDALAERATISAAARLEWLRLDPSHYTPELYEQLTAVYRRAGREEDARRVAITKQQQRRNELGRPGKLWSLLLGGLVGHGYRTWRAAGWLVALVALGWWIFDCAHNPYPAHLIGLFVLKRGVVPC